MRIFALSMPILLLFLSACNRWKADVNMGATSDQNLPQLTPIVIVHHIRGLPSRALDISGTPPQDIFQTPTYLIPDGYIDASMAPANGILVATDAFGGITPSTLIPQDLTSDVVPYTHHMSAAVVSCEDVNSIMDSSGCVRNGQDISFKAYAIGLYQSLRVKINGVLSNIPKHNYVLKRVSNTGQFGYDSFHGLRAVKPDYALFVANDENGDNKLFKIDKSDVVTQLFDDGPGGDYPSIFGAQSDGVYFNLGSGRELMRVNLSGMIQKVSDAQGGSSIDFNGHVYFPSRSNGNDKLYKRDSSGVTTQVTNLVDGMDDNIDVQIVMNDELYFTAQGSDSLIKLYKITAGDVVTKLTDTYPGNNDDPFSFTIFNNELYFSSYVDNSMTKLFKVNSSGVVTKVTDNNPAGTDDVNHLIVFDGDLYFSALKTDPLYGFRKIFKLTSSGALSQVSDINSGGSDDPANFKVIGDYLYFLSLDNTYDSELYKFSKTGVISKAVDVNPNGQDKVSSYVALNNDLYFSATKTDGFNKLFKLSGPGELYQISDMNPGQDDNIGTLEVFNNHLYVPAGGNMYKLLMIDN